MDKDGETYLDILPQEIWNIILAKLLSILPDPMEIMAVNKMLHKYGHGLLSSQLEKREIYKLLPETMQEIKKYGKQYQVIATLTNKHLTIWRSQRVLLLWASIENSTLKYSFTQL